jgi:hypothetical protein
MSQLNHEIHRSLLIGVARRKRVATSVGVTRD